MSVSNSKGEAAGDPLEIMPAGASGIEGQTPAPRIEQPAPARAKPPKPYRALVGPVDMLGERWLHEVSHWKRRLIRCRPASKLAVKIGIELALSVDRTPGSPTAGVAVRSYPWFVKELGSSRSKVQLAVAELVNLGFVTVESSRREGVANRYVLAFPVTRWVDDDDDFPPF